MVICLARQAAKKQAPEAYRGANHILRKSRDPNLQAAWREFSLNVNPEGRAMMLVLLAPLFRRVWASKIGPRRYTKASQERISHFMLQLAALLACYKAPSDLSQRPRYASRARPFFRENHNALHDNLIQVLKEYKENMVQ
jgi:hypothetical protein